MLPYCLSVSRGRRRFARGPAAIFAWRANAPAGRTPLRPWRLFGFDSQPPPSPPSSPPWKSPENHIVRILTSGGYFLSHCRLTSTPGLTTASLGWASFCTWRPLGKKRPEEAPIVCKMAGTSAIKILEESRNPTISFLGRISQCHSHSSNRPQHRSGRSRHVCGDLEYHQLILWHSGRF